MRTGIGWFTLMSAAVGGEGGEGGGGDGGSGSAGGSDDGGAGASGSSLGTSDGGVVVADPAGGETPPGGVLPEWAPELKDPDLSNWIAKRGERWAGIEDMVRSHKDLESLRGVPETQLIKLAPTEDKEAWHGPGGIYSKLGRPDNPSQYNLPKIEETGDVFDITSPFREAAFEEGLSGGAVERIGAKVFGKMFEFQEAYNTETQRSMSEGMETLRREWGQEFDSNHSIAKKGAEALGFDTNSEEGLNTLGVIEREIGTRAFMHHMLQIGQRLGEHQAGEHGGGQAGPTFMTPDAAQAEITRLKADTEFVKAYLNGSEEHTKRMNQLFEFANPS